jgi:hypothetical protein
MRLFGHLLDRLSDLFGLPNFEGLSPIAEPELVVIPFERVVHRLHTVSHYHPSALWRVFLDGPWKWDAHERFAGNGFNCGHFFSMTEEGSRAEATFYGLDENRIPIELDLRLPRVLDLTDARCLRYVLDPRIGLDIRPRSMHALRLLELLVDGWAGGSMVTSVVGHWAVRKDFDGILFIGARALSQQTREDVRFSGGGLSMGSGFTGEDELEEIRKDPNVVNLVVLSGRRVLTGTCRYRQRGEPWRENPCYRITEEEHDRLLWREGVEWDSHYQRGRTPIRILSGRRTAVSLYRPEDGDPRRSSEQLASERASNVQPPADP